MRIKTACILLLVITTCLATTPASNRAKPQTTRTYQQMTAVEQRAFVREQARRLARLMSGRDYEFTPAFEAEIQKGVDSYVRRINNGAGDQLGKGDVRFVLERGQAVAPKLIGAFKAREVSPLIGLYLPLVESEYVNLQAPNEQGSVGMFQFMPQTGLHLGLSRADLLDVQKSADAAARYIAANIEQFRDDQMKEALAVLSYNRGAQKVEDDVAALVNEQNNACSICVLTEQRNKLDASFRRESVYYVPRFFAAAIIGENPQAFGLPTAPLSSL
jgi:Transglycosylase SLT domain